MEFRIGLFVILVFNKKPKSTVILKKNEIRNIMKINQYEIH
jgi:hypothetical protein